MDDFVQRRGRRGAQHLRGGRLAGGCGRGGLAGFGWGGGAGAQDKGGAGDQAELTDGLHASAILKLMKKNLAELASRRLRVDGPGYGMGVIVPQLMRRGFDACEGRVAEIGMMSMVCLLLMNSIHHGNTCQ